MRVAALQARTSDRTDGPREGAVALARALDPAARLIGTPAPGAPAPWDEDLRACRDELLALPGDLDVLCASQCTIALATLPRRPEGERILWLDAHGDFNTPDTSESGYLGGMPLAGACGVWDAGLGLPAVDPARVVMVGVRDLDARERILVDGHGIARLTVAEAARELAGQPVFVHLDCDVFGPERIPGLDFPVPGGLDPEAVRGLFAGLDVTAWEVTALPPGGVAVAQHVLRDRLPS
jgi:arginase family enzyme